MNDFLNCEARILVMDDEAIIREVVVELLKELGYEATAVEDGKKCLEVYDEATVSGKPFDLVILDMNVSQGMGGIETIDLLRKIDPKVKAMASSGSSYDPVMEQPHKFGFQAALEKPFDLEKLASAVNAVLKKH